jgi:hypothetical protein
VEIVHGGSENGYLLIKSSDLKKVPMIPAEWIVASDSSGIRTWYLVEFNKPAANKRAELR